MLKQEAYLIAKEQSILCAKEGFFNKILLFQIDMITSLMLVWPGNLNM